MPLQIKPVTLPVSEVIPRIKHSLAKENTLIVTAPPGAGKSTLLPISLVDEPWLGGQKILMLEPRRLAARAIASRMSDLIGENIGDTIGYRVRFENKIGKNTRIEVVTEGILTRMLQSDNMLEGVGMVIFDEFHERSLFADLALALCREVQEILRPDLRIMIMSATLDVPMLASRMEASVVESPGRMFPVGIRYQETTELNDLVKDTVKTVMQAVTTEVGDALVFLPGEAEIARCEEILTSRLDERFVIHPLYGQLPQTRQQAAIIPDKTGRRKIVLATSIAETSLTIEGIRIVVDSGFRRTPRFNPQTGLSRLETVRISQDMAEQRSGRAGRLDAGVCFRMWSKATHDRLDTHRVPEMEEADLSAFMLDIACWGESDVEGMTWLTPPPRSSLFRAKELLTQLDALSDDKVTPYGRKMNRIPCHPRIAHMLIRAQESGHSALGADLAAVLEERDPLGSDSGADINLRIEALRRFRQRKSGLPILDRIEKAAASYRRIIEAQPDNAPVNPDLTGFLLAQAYPERLAQSLGHGIFQLSGGNRARLDLSDPLAHSEWICIAHLDNREGIGKVFLASPISVADLFPYSRQREFISWDTRKGGIISRREWRYGNMLIQHRPLPKNDPALVIPVICEAIRVEGQHLLDFNDEVIQWQNRVLSLRIWQPDVAWPDVTTETLLSQCESWILPYLEGVSRTEQLKKINLKQVLQFHLSYELQQKIDFLAPERITVPSGSQIRLAYFADGAQPVLAVRLQECFGLEQTPRVFDDQITVLMHLLSPGFKPVQITSDLSSFWSNAYYDVKKELKSRYPKHVWPEDPRKQQAVRGTKKQNGL